MSAGPADAPRRVAVVLFDGFTVLDVYGPVQAFAAARAPAAEGGRRWFEILTLAESPGPVRSGDGPATHAEHALGDPPPFDILLIPGGFGTRQAVDDPRLIAALAAASGRAAITATVCTGAALLARTGRLDDRPATSNKLAWDWVVAQGPRVRWRRHARWVDDGDVLTSSGVSAGIDMALALIARECGRALALTAARNMEYVWRDDPDDDPFA
ncbi:MAG TPA: DJ-1/PfpI family protein [Methylomirabilota bacterium]|jgi:transcriptional regulator GlxA family with amidase domain|nr:DJ-1/PfpI family protein [Methylomirabilota bacterium]